MSRKKDADPPCPRCGCPEVHEFVRQNAQGFYSYSSCPGCGSINGEPPAKRKAGK